MAGEEPTLEVMLGAQAKFALFVASLLQRAGVTSMAEFANLLRTFAEAVAETDPAEADILVDWAEAIAPHSIN